MLRITWMASGEDVLPPKEIQVSMGFDVEVGKMITTWDAETGIEILKFFCGNI